MAYKISPYKDEDELPNVFNATSALHYFRVLQDLMYDWTHAQTHEMTLMQNLVNDKTPPGL